MNKTVSRRFKKFRLSGEAKELLSEIATLLVAFALSSVRFFFSTYPFAIAFCAASRKRAPFAFAGAALGITLLLDADVAYLVTLLALICLRIAGSVWLGDNGKRDLSLGKAPRPSFLSALFTERVSVRVALAALCALGISVSRVVIGGYTYYDIFVLVFFTVFVSIFTYALCTLYEPSARNKRLLGLAALAFVLVFAIRGIEFFGLDVSIILSYALVLYSSKYVSGASACALGALLGICHGVSFAPVFAIAALVSTFLWSFSYYLAIISALVMSLGYGVFASGYEAIVYLLPELLLASLIMYPLTKFEILPRPSFVRDEVSQSGAVIISDSRTALLKDRLTSSARALRELSEMIYGVSAKAKSPDREFYRDTCLEVCEKYCYLCPKRQICWERDCITTKDNLRRMGDFAYSEKVLTLECIDEKFLHRCPNIDKIADEINRLKHELSVSGAKGDRLDISAQDYELTSRLFEELAADMDTDMERNGRLSDKVSHECAKIGLCCEQIEVFGDKYKRIIATGIDTGSSKCTMSELKAAVESAVGAALTEPEIKDVGGVAVLSMQSMRRFEASSAGDSVKKSSEEQNGDTLCSFFGPSEKFYMLLCDGMGSGKDASFTSGMCSEFLKKILVSSHSRELCLCMLNSFIRAKSLECSSSIDLLELDLINGSGSFVKSGAAPSFVKRGSNVFRLHSKTAPIGIMKELDAERLDFNLRDGDIVIMISDGICSDEKDSKYLVDFLSECEISEDGEMLSEPSDTTVITGKKETLSPANLKKSPVRGSVEEGGILFSVPDGEKEETDIKDSVKITLAELPRAIISLAAERTGSISDDKTVGVIRIRAV